MDANFKLLAVEGITLFMMVAVIAIYSLSSYWYFLILSKEKHFCPICFSCGVVCGAFALVFVYILFMYVVGRPIEISVFSSLVIRPFTFMTGALLGAHARTKLSELKRKEKTTWKGQK